MLSLVHVHTIARYKNELMIINTLINRTPPPSPLLLELGWGEVGHCYLCDLPPMGLLGAMVCPTFPPPILSSFHRYSYFLHAWNEHVE